MVDTGEKTLLMGDDGTIRVYTRRWYILFLFSFLALYQCTVWNTWGPVTNSVEQVWHWDTDTVSLMANWSFITFLVFMVPVLYLQDLSLRAAVVVSSCLVSLATVIRCVFLVSPSLSTQTFTVLCHISSILNGIPSIVVTAAPAAVSAAWFPPQERVTATSISQMLNNIGQGMSFLVASLMVGGGTPQGTNSTDNTTDNSTAAVMELKTEMEHYLLFLSGPATVLFLLTVLYFPSKPPSPPSRSSREARMDFWPGAMQLVKNPNSWGLAIVWAVPQSVWNNWCAMMVVSLTKVGYNNELLTERWASHLGLIAVLVGTLTAIMVGTATSRIKGVMKTTIMSLLTAGGLLFSLLALLTLQILEMPSMTLLQAFIYIFLLLGNSCVVSTSPLLFEFGVEKLYPISEGMIGGWLNIWYSIISVIFLGLFSIPNIGTRWLSFALPVSCFSVLPIMTLIKEEYRRRNVDEEDDKDEERPHIRESGYESNQVREFGYGSSDVR